jgi:O-antigen ligase
VGQQQSDMPGRIVAWTIGLAPVLLLLLTWGETLAPWQRAMRSFAIPIVITEAVVVALAAFYRPRPRPSWMWIPLGALIILAWATAIAADRPFWSIIRTGVWSIHLLYGFSIFCLWRRGVLKAEYLVDALLAGFVVFTILLVAFIAIHYRPGYNWVINLPAYSHIRWYAAYAAAAVGLTIVGIGEGKPDRLAIAALAWTVSFWTGARGPLWAVIAALLICTFFIPSLRNRGMWLRLAAAFVVSVTLAGIATAIAPLGKMGVDRLSNGGLSGRLEVWQAITGKVLQRPWFGWGEAQVSYQLTKNLRVTHPHDVLLQILHAWGFAGFALISLLAVWLIRKVTRGACDKTLPLLCAGSTIAAYSLISGSLYHVQSVSIFALCAACLAANAPPSSSRPRPHSPSPEAPRQPDPSSAA